MSRQIIPNSINWAKFIEALYTAQITGFMANLNTLHWYTSSIYSIRQHQWPAPNKGEAAMHDKMCTPHIHHNLPADHAKAYIIIPSSIQSMYSITGVFGKEQFFVWKWKQVCCRRFGVIEGVWWATSSVIRWWVSGCGYSKYCCCCWCYSWSSRQRCRGSKGGGSSLKERGITKASQ